VKTTTDNSLITFCIEEHAHACAQEEEHEAQGPERREVSRLMIRVFRHRL